MMGSYDFGGWATRNDLKCSDGRTIRHNAFKGNDGQVVPLVWNHQHNESTNVLGHALLENRDDGVYAYGTFNDTEAGRNAKELVVHGDVTSLSIYANQLKQKGGDVLHGAIREVSLVLAGANPGAYIDDIMCHSDGEEGEAIIYVGDELDFLSHADGDNQNKDEEDDSEETVEDVFNTLTEKQKKLVYALITNIVSEENSKAVAQHSDEDEHIEHAESSDKDDETLEDVYNTLNDKQKKLVEVLLGQATEDLEKGDNEDMKHNVFENDEQGTFLSHADVEEIFGDAKRYGSLKDSVMAHSASYGIEDIDMLFPDAKTINSTPDFIKRRTEWVAKVMGQVHHSPMSRIKSIHADITEDAARAKGYIKGNLKKEEVFSLLKRITTPTTIYKKQKFDRDDIIDITDFDVIAWVKAEMRMMLEEEIARAILIGDGRLASDNDHINETNIRPVVTDDDLYAVKKNASANAKDFIKDVIRARKDYKGAGNPTLYTTEDTLTEMLLIEDTTGRVIYDTLDKLTTALRVKEIVTIPVMEGLVVTQKDGKQYDVKAVLVNLADYNVGADKGGAVSMFDDFDIDYNQQKYLIETRISGALTTPYSAIVFQSEHTAG